MKYYYIDIIGRSNSYYRGIADKIIATGTIKANSIKDAKEKAWKTFDKIARENSLKAYGDTTMHFLRRTDVKIIADWTDETEETFKIYF